METDEMTQAELSMMLETLADLIEAKAETAADAAELLRKKAKEIKA